MYWNNGKLYVVTGFNQAVLASSTPLAQQLADRWKTDFELAQLLLRAGYRLQQK